MKIKCIDGITRDFQISNYHKLDGYMGDAYCKHCKKNFGVHDTKILIPEFKNHICSNIYDSVENQRII